MSIEVLSATSRARIESADCTPDGNCFVGVYGQDQFILRIKGP